MTNDFSNLGGRLKLFVNQWRDITHDNNIIQLILGVSLELLFTPYQLSVPLPYNLGSLNSEISAEVDSFLARNIIEKCEHESGEIISNIFCRRKKSGKIRIIGNFKEINLAVKYHKFKQSTLLSTLDLIRPNAFMCTIDLTDAYYCVNVSAQHRKFLKFIWKDQLYRFIGLPQGVGCSPRIFTKIMKVPISHLREQGITVSAYIDDLIVIADSYEQCLEDSSSTVELLQKLGYVVNFEKSTLVPSQITEYLGVLINSQDMTVRLTTDKCNNIKKLCQDSLHNTNISIRDMAKLTGTMVSYLPGAELGKLHYRGLELCKNRALRLNKGNFDATMVLSDHAKQDILWWLYNVDKQLTHLIHPPPTHTITTDSSLKMWGAHTDVNECGGIWDNAEKTIHINTLETKAILLGLQALGNYFDSCHIRIQTDSKVAMAYINNKGGLVSRQCNSLALQIWEWAINRNCHLSAIHIAGKDNLKADYLSRNQDNSSEWSLDGGKLNRILTHFQFSPTIDLFASRINFKVDRYVAWQPDPGSLLTNTLMNVFENERFYAFPPFNLISKFLKKVILENLDGIIVVPCWSTQPFFPVLIQTLIDLPVMIKWNNNLLSNPTREAHPLGKRLRLMACRISGNSSHRKDFLKTLSRLCAKDGQNPHIDNIKLTLQNGKLIVNKKTVITLTLI